MNALKHIRAGALVAALLVTSIGITAPASAQSTALTTAGDKAVAWLLTKQEKDGGFGTGFSKGSDIGATADAVMAIAASGKNVASVKNSAGRSPIDFFAQQLKLRKAINAGQYVKMALALKAAGLDARNFNGSDVTKPILAAYNAQTGVIGDNVYTHALAVLALARNGVPAPEKAIDKLISLQGKTGGWAFAGGDDADVDTTALAVQALIASGKPAKTGVVGKAINYLRSLQNADGGYPYQVPSQFGTESNANSTALVAQAIIASGDQPESWPAAKGNPLSALLNMQTKSGAFSYQLSLADENVLATAGAVPALFRKTVGQ
jgi:prenyltransferase beta subunit